MKRVLLYLIAAFAMVMTSPAMAEASASVYAIDSTYQVDTVASGMQEMPCFACSNTLNMPAVAYTEPVERPFFAAMSHGNSPINAGLTGANDQAKPYSGVTAA